MSRLTKNFSEGQLPYLLDEYDGFTFRYHNPIDDAGTMRPHRLFPGDDTPRTFIDCNMVNCLPPPGSTVIRCNLKIISHDHALPPADTVTIGATVITRPAFENRLYGRVDPETLTVQYLPTPRTLPR